VPLVAIVVAYALVGVVAGFVWEALWRPPAQVVSNHSVFYTSYESLRRVFAGTVGLYTMVGAVGSLVTALTVCLLTRRRELLTLVAVVLGSSLAAWLMKVVGVARGPADPLGIAAHAANGTKVSGPLQVSGHSPYLIWPMMSLFVLALVFFGRPSHAPPTSHHRAEDPDDGDRVEAGVGEGSRG
jgi:hypothetical protein